MTRLPIIKLLSTPDLNADVSVCGWVRSFRKSAKVAFVVLSDGSTQDNLQLVIPSESPAFDALDGIGTGASICAVGRIVESPAKGQKYEMNVTSIRLMGGADPATYPLQKKGHTLEFLREIEHLRPRTNTMGAVMRVRNRLAYEVHRFFQGRGFYWVHTPIISGSDCEGAGELFTVTTLDMTNPPRDADGTVDYGRDFFGGRAFLTVSGQMEAEMMASAMGKVYTFGPTFRAENSNTARHLSEFWMIEPEVAFADLDEDVGLAVALIKRLCASAIEGCPDELAFLSKHYELDVERLGHLAGAEFPVMTYTDAIGELERSGREFQYPVAWGHDLQTEHERFICEEVVRGPVVIVDYPIGIKPFYMKVGDDGRTVRAMDVLVPGVGEIVGGSQREDRYDLLVSRMKDLGIPREGYEWYLDLRRYGGAPSAGFGLGFDRFVQYVTAMKNIRDVIPCPRTPGGFGRKGAD